ncbi:MAG TPA: histidinol phosphate phosphatase [Candidatus Blautia avistercoris]|nr:histidinol phosphate phosphatase [Candidatus Blautia avistercoris]
MLKDVHIHLERGTYTKDWVTKFVSQAQKKGLDEIYLLEHTHRFREFLPMYRHLYGTNGYFDSWLDGRGSQRLSDYLKLAEEMRKESFPVKVRWGLEVCYFPDWEEFIKRETQDLPLDFLTGSIHWIDGFGFDHKKELWEGKDTDQEYERYYELMEELIDSGLFTGLAHPDSIKCFGRESSRDLEETYGRLAGKLKEQGMYAEQSSGLFNNYGYAYMGMNPQMLAVFQREQVPIETASDAHCPEDVGKGIGEMAQKLEKGELKK